MKIIDLLNKIANGKEVPKKIEYRNIKFVYDKANRLYIVENYNEYNDLLMELSNHKGTDLNYEVEILEEEKKIPEKLENEHEFYSYAKYEENKNEIDKVLYILKAINLIEEKIGNLNNSVNEIIDYLDYLKSKD